MPQAWLADGAIKVSIVAPAAAKCEIKIVSDLGKTYRSAHTIGVRPHDCQSARNVGPLSASNIHPVDLH
jgi:hypothetical protein